MFYKHFFVNYKKLNLPRAKERRKPQDIRSINQPFNGSEFNFTWVDQKEVVFYLKHKSCQSELRNCEVSIAYFDLCQHNFGVMSEKDLKMLIDSTSECSCSFP